MKIHTLLLATAALLVQTGAGLAAEEKFESKTTITRDDKGDYKRKEETTSVDPAGTATKVEQEVKVDMDKDGGYKRTTTTKKVTDPRGLLNKHVVETKQVDKVENGKVLTTSEKKVDGKNVLGDRDNYSAKTEISRDASGNYDENTTITKKDAAGKTTYKKQAVVDVKPGGAIDKKTTTKEVRDPKGLMNKQTVDTSNTQTIDNGVVSSGQEIKVDGKVVESRKTSSPQ